MVFTFRSFRKIEHLTAPASDRFDNRATSFAWATGSLAIAVLSDSVLLLIRIGPIPSSDAIVPISSLWPARPYVAIGGKSAHPQP
jgi:hypothetical protein